MNIKNYLHKICTNGSVMVLIITGCLYGSVMLVQASSASLTANLMKLDASSGPSAFDNDKEVFTHIINIEGKQYKLLLREI